MADPSLTNSATGTSSVATTTASFGFTATANRLLVLIVGADDYKTGNPSGYTLPTGGSQQTYLGHYLWYKIAAGGETSVQYTIGSASKSAWIVLEYDNIDTSSPLDVSNGQLAQSSSLTYTTPSVTPSTGRRLAIASIGGSAAADFTGLGTWLNSYTEVAESSHSGSGTRDIVGAATLLLDGNGSTSTSSGATYSGATAQSRTGIIAVFKGAASGGATINTTPATGTASGRPAQLVLGRVIGTTPATATAQTSAARVSAGRTIGTTPATATASGRPAQLVVGRVVGTTRATATATPAAAKVVVGRVVGTTRATATASGTPAQILAGGLINATPATATASGRPAQIVRAQVVGTATATATASGRLAQIVAGRVINASRATATASGAPASVIFSSGNLVGTIPATATAAGRPAQIVVGRVIGAAPATATASGAPASVITGATISVVQPYCTVYFWRRTA